MSSYAQGAGDNGLPDSAHRANAEPMRSVIDLLLAERYGRSVWWERKADPRPEPIDDELTTAKRRRVLREVADQAREETA